jgi:hypothetical protein
MCACLNRDVVVAEANSGDLHHHFIGSRRLKFDLGEGESCAHILHYRG